MDLSGEEECNEFGLFTFLERGNCVLEKKLI